MTLRLMISLFAAAATLDLDNEEGTITDSGNGDGIAADIALRCLPPLFYYAPQRDMRARRALILPLMLPAPRHAPR